MKRFRQTEYFVSKEGNVFRNGKMLKGSKTKKGYIQIKVYTNESISNIYIHRMVGELYIPNPDNKSEINHLDGDKTNNSVLNLVWCTSSENKKHAFQYGLRKKGEESYNAKLKKEDIVYIKKNYKPRDKKYGGKQLAEKFGVSKGSISSIIKNINWKDI